MRLQETKVNLKFEWNSERTHSWPITPSRVRIKGSEIARFFHDRPVTEKPSAMYGFPFPFHFPLSHFFPSSPFLLLFLFSLSFLIPFSISFPFLALPFCHNTHSQRYRMLQVVKNHLTFWKNAVLPVHTQCFSHCREQGTVAVIRIKEPWYPFLWSAMWT